MAALLVGVAANAQTITGAPPLTLPVRPTDEVFIFRGNTPVNSTQIANIFSGIVGAVTSVTGTAGQINASPSTGAVVLSLPPTITPDETFSGAINFTGPFKISGVTQTFPASGLIVGTTDTQTLTNKTLTSPIINGGTINNPTIASGMLSGTFTGGPTFSGNLIFSGTNSHTGVETFASVFGKSRTVAGTTDTLVATDCGISVVYTNASPITVTIPAAIVPASGTVCNLGVVQMGTAKVSVNGSAVTPATLVSADSFTGTSGSKGATIGLWLSTVSSVATAVLTGRGS